MNTKKNTYYHQIQIKNRKTITKTLCPDESLRQTLRRGGSAGANTLTFPEIRRARPELESADVVSSGFSKKSQSVK